MYDLRSRKRSNPCVVVKESKVAKNEQDDTIYDADSFVESSDSDSSDSDSEEEESPCPVRELATEILGDYMENLYDPLVSHKRDLDDGTIEILNSIEQNINDNAPTLDKIIHSGLSDSDKELAIQYFKILGTTQKNTMDYLFVSDKITNLLHLAPEVLDDETKKSYQHYRNKLAESHPTIPKIINAKLTESDKIKALQLYEVLQNCNKSTSYWFELESKINTILASELSSHAEVQKLEEEESSLKLVTLSHNGDIKKEIFALDTNLDTKRRLYDMYTEMLTHEVGSSRYNDIMEKLRWAIKLPHQRVSPSLLIDKSPESIRKYCIDVYNKLDNDLYGMREVKEKVIQTINDRIYNPNSRSLLALKGKPGVGKTKLAKTIAKAAGLPFDKINLGGTIDVTLFKGSDGVWSGASPSMILQILSRVKCSNAVILLDEIDKLSTTDKGLEVQNSLLHILDSSQNEAYQDTFLCEFPHDLSKIWFISSLNDDSNLHPALKDRLNIVEVPSYTQSDMVEIIKRHTLPEMLADKGFNSNDVVITDDASRTLLTTLNTGKSGMRVVERAISDIVSKINLARSLCADTSLSTLSLPLTYTLPNFNGLPYTITTETINALMKPNNKMHYPMYL